MEKSTEEYKKLVLAVNKLIKAIDANTTSDLWKPSLSETAVSAVLYPTAIQEDVDDENSVVEYIGFVEELEAVAKLLGDSEEVLGLITDCMDFNGYGWKNTEAFNQHSEEACYVPENAESVDDIYNRARLEKLCEECIAEFELTVSVEVLAELLFTSIDWQFPETWLVEYVELLED